jgi:hypothetical protein
MDKIRIDVQYTSVPERVSWFVSDDHNYHLFDSRPGSVTEEWVLESTYLNVTLGEYVIQAENLMGTWQLNHAIHRQIHTLFSYQVCMSTRSLQGSSKFMGCQRKGHLLC